MPDEHEEDTVVVDRDKIQSRVEDVMRSFAGLSGFERGIIIATVTYGYFVDTAEEFLELVKSLLPAVREVNEQAKTLKGEPTE